MTTEPKTQAVESVLSFLSPEQLLALYSNVTEGAAPLLAAKDVCKCGGGSGNCSCSCGSDGCGCTA